MTKGVYTTFVKTECIRGNLGILYETLCIRSDIVVGGNGGKVAKSNRNQRPCKSSIRSRERARFSEIDIFRWARIFFDDGTNAIILQKSKNLDLKMKNINCFIEKRPHSITLSYCK